ncbi:MAG: acyl-CoA thioesterase [Prolixibacteraceae bacterium]|nr:acyl-CoA thioesterase [Prolixibacteraceae bacterium]
MMNFYHTTPVQIRFNDIDLAKHVNNSIYPQYFDLARLGYFDEVFGEFLGFEDTGTVIASIKIDFFHPIVLTDKVFVKTKVISLGNKSFEMLQHIVQQGETEPLATADTIMVCFNYTRNETQEIPDEWRKKICNFEKGETG